MELVNHLKWLTTEKCYVRAQNISHIETDNDCQPLLQMMIREVSLSADGFG